MKQQTEQKQTTPATIVEHSYKTSSANRLTTAAEFNADADVMVACQRMLLTVEGRIHEKGPGKNDRRKKLSDSVLQYAKSENERLKKKTWGVFVSIQDKLPQPGEQYWVRETGGKPVKRIFEGEHFIDAEGAIFPATQWSEIYK